MIFSKDTMHVGGKVNIPDSLIAKSLGVSEGEIVEVTPMCIKVQYPNKTAKTGKVTAIYSYRWLNQHYGEKGPNDAIPF